MKHSVFLIGGLACLLACNQPAPIVKVKQSPDLEKGEAFLKKQQSDSAYYYFDKVTTSTKDSLQTAMAYNYMASIQADAGDLFGAQETLTQSLKYLREDKPADHYCLASDYNELGSTSSRLKNYENALSYFDQALKFSDDQDYRLIFTNNKANAYRKNRNYPKAITLYRQVLAQNTRGSTAYARTLTNMASAKWLNTPAYDPAPEFLEALHIRQNAGDLWGQNSSYAHLADYYSISRPGTALNYATQRYALAVRLNSPDDQLEGLQKLIELSPAGQTKVYFARYQQLNDSLQTARNAAKNQFALIRYHTEKNKANNLKLQKENAEKQYQLIRRSFQFYTAVFIFIIASVFAALWYSKKKSAQEKEKQDAVSETQHKASKKVHDTLANDIYRIMKRIQQHPTPNQDWLVDEIEDVYQRARDISHEMAPGAAADFQETISMLLKSFGSEHTKVVLAGNNAELWNKINPAYKFELKYILQELMVNMEKHSQATNVVIRFEELGDQCLITYFDNGIGLSAATRQNGLINTGNRIKTIKGSITFENSTGKGLEIRIAFPIA